ncbi:MAG TPA: hypothetical protein VJ769_08020, partial [Actinomycetes bacterium]|nr:hypothetical protein [Actinomycetes bacterium]
MTIVSNYSDLSPAMRAGLGHWNTAKAGTRKALIARGLVQDHRGVLTEAGQRAQAHLLADVPAKVAPYLDRARQAGLEIRRPDDSGTLKSWTISTPNPIDRTQIWLYWSPGARGGRLAVTVYYGPHTKTKCPPLRHINYTIQAMAESLDRHNQREAAKTEAA